VEEIREIKIVVKVDTNKQTYEQDFDDIADAIVYLESILRNLD